MTKKILSSITHLEANVNYTIFHYENGRKDIRSYTMKRFEEQLADFPNFRRIHRKFIVNLNFVVKDTGELLILKGGEELPISRLKRKTLKIN